MSDLPPLCSPMLTRVQTPIELGCIALVAELPGWWPRSVLCHSLGLSKGFIIGVALWLRRHKRSNGQMRQRPVHFDSLSPIRICDEEPTKAIASACWFSTVCAALAGV